MRIIKAVRQLARNDGIASQTMRTNTKTMQGVLDDLNVINSIKPGAELYAPERVKWISVSIN